MIILNLKGGLGNQMFEYGLGRYLSRKNKTDLKFSIGHYDAGWGNYDLSAFNIEEKFATSEEISHFKKFQKKTGRRWFLYNLFVADGTKYIQEKYFHFDPDILELKDNTYLDGWWQTEKYFSDIRDVLLKDFTLKQPLSGKNKDVAGKITTANSVSIHIRRKDFVTNPKTNHIHGALPKEYYDKALAYISSRIENLALFVFSDDIPWVRENLSFHFETVYIDWNDKSPHEDIRLMSLCQHNIIANSAFSWWGAWLNPAKDKIVIAPKRWFANASKCDTKDIIPKNWIKV